MKRPHNIARLKASALTRDIPVVVFSADATASQIERLRIAGARAYLTKPLDVTEFLRPLETLLPPGATKILRVEEFDIGASDTLLSSKKITGTTARCGR